MGKSPIPVNPVNLLRWPADAASSCSIYFADGFETASRWMTAAAAVEAEESEREKHLTDHCSATAGTPGRADTR
jgi:hypothetical protein